MVTVPSDETGLYYIGPNDLKPAGTQVGATDFAIQHVLLVDASNNPLGVNAAATASDEGAESATDEAIAVAGAGTRLIGFSARETAGATAVFNIRHGTGNTDPILVSVSLNANESTREWYGPDGIAAASGIWLERVSGTVQFTGYSKVAS